MTLPIVQHRFGLWNGPSSRSLCQPWPAGTHALEPEDVLGHVIEDEDEIERVTSEIRAVQSAKAALQTD